MPKLEYCPFCGGEEVDVVPEFETTADPAYPNSKRESIRVYVECEHCAARGPSFVEIKTRDGEWMTTLEDLYAQAVDEWNSSDLRLNPLSRRLRQGWQQLCYDVRTLGGRIG